MMARVSRDVFQVEGLGETLRLLNKLPKEAKKDLRAEVQQMTGKHAKYLAAQAARSTKRRVCSTTSGTPRWPMCAPTA